MAKRFPGLLPIFFFFFLSMTSVQMSSCKAKEGCGLEEKYNNPDMDSKGGKSNLFSKSQRKKMNRG
jgi:hypothetical protein